MERYTDMNKIESTKVISQFKTINYQVCEANKICLGKVLYV